jgi:hypothetical protein
MKTQILVAFLLSLGTRAGQAHGNDKAAARADDLVGWMALRSDAVHALLREARVRREESRAECLDAMLDQAHAAERQAGDINVELQRAAAEGDDQVMGNHMLRLRVLAERSRELLHQSRKCGLQPRRTR